MKRTTAILSMTALLMLLPAGKLFPFGLELGLKGGIVRAQAEISRDLDGATWGPLSEAGFGAHAAVFFIADQFGFQPEILFTVKGFDMLETDQGQQVSSKYKISYVEIPLLLVYKLPLRGRIKPGVAAGPYFGIAQKVREVQTAFGVTEERELGENLMETDAGLVFEGNVRYELGLLTVAAAVRYSFGFDSISSNIRDASWDFHSGDTIKNRALTVMLGIGFNIL